MKKIKTMLVIYYDNNGGCRQIIKPNFDSQNKKSVFNGNWNALANAISGGTHKKIEII